MNQSIERHQVADDFLVIRRRYLVWERVAHSIGDLFGIVAGLTGFALIDSFDRVVVLILVPERAVDREKTIGFVSLFGFSLALAIGFRRLQSWARYLLLLSSTPLLLYFPRTGVLAVAMIGLLFIPPMAFVFSKTYQQLREETHDVAYRTSPLLFSVLVLLLITTCIWSSSLLGP